MMNTEIKKKKKEVCYKEMTHTIMEADKPKTCSIGPQARDPRKLILQFQSSESLLKSSILPMDAEFFFFYSASKIFFKV